MLVRFKTDDPRFKIKAGDVFIAERYKYDPDKVTLIYRVSDDYVPECNAYLSQVEFLPVLNEAANKWANERKKN